MMASLDVEITEDELEQTRAIVRKVFGADTRVEPGIARFGVGDLPWELVITGIPWTLFIAKFAELGAEDAYAGLKMWVRRLGKARKGKSGGVMVYDEDTRTYMWLSGDLPEEAFEQLRGINMARGDYPVSIGWDAKRRRWVKN